MSCYTYTYTYPLMRLKQRSVRFNKLFCRQKAVVVLRKVAEGVLFDCSQYGFFAVFALYLRFPAVLGEPRLEPHK